MSKVSELNKKMKYFQMVDADLETLLNTIDDNADYLDNDDIMVFIKNFWNDYTQSVMLIYCGDNGTFSTDNACREFFESDPDTQEEFDDDFDQYLDYVDALVHDPGSDLLLMRPNRNEDQMIKFCSDILRIIDMQEEADELEDYL